MNKSKPRLSEIREYVAHESYKMTFALMCMISLLLLLLDGIYSKQAMLLSISIIIELQKFDLTVVAFFFGYIIYGVMYFYVVLALIFRKNQESNFSLAFGTFFLMYISALSKMILLGHRPFFISNEVNSSFCICDYGNPSSHAIIGLGTLMLIYTDIVHNEKISRNTAMFMKIIIVLAQAGISFSRLYLGAHSLNQITIGWSIGITAFLGIRRLNDYLQKYIMWPMFYKDRFRNKLAISHLLFHMMWTNYLIFLVWSYRFTKFDLQENEYFTFNNCKMCSVELEQNFSVKVVKDALWFNIYFGMMFGIYISTNTRFKHSGFYSEGSIVKCLLRVFIFICCMSPLILALYPSTDNTIVTFVRILILSVVTGMLYTYFFYEVLKFLNLEIVSSNKNSISTFSGFSGAIIFKV